MSWYESTENTIFSTDTCNLPSANPLFVDTDTYEFRPRTGSPAIGKTDPAYAPAGQPRPTPPDLGAVLH